MPEGPRDCKNSQVLVVHRSKIANDCNGTRIPRNRFSEERITLDLDGIGSASPAWIEDMLEEGLKGAGVPTRGVPCNRKVGPMGSEGAPGLRRVGMIGIPDSLELRNTQGS